MLANLTTDKIEDGVARCLSKNDVKSVALKPKMDMATAAEEHLSDAFDIVKAISTVEKCLKPLGQFFVRVALKLTGAERKGRENKIYTWHEMRNKFLADMSEVVARSSCTKTNKVHQDNKFLADMSEIPSITFAKWSEALVNDADTYKATSKASVKPDKSASGSGSADCPATIATLDDHTDPVWICRQAGFEVGKQVIEKKVESGHENLYVIFKIDSEVQLHQVVSYRGAPRKVSVSIDELLNNWHITKMEAPVTMMDAPAALPDYFEEALKQHEVLKALIDLYEKQQRHYNSLAYYRRPDHVRTKTLIKAKGLVLVPVPPPSNIFYDQKPGGIPIDECCVVTPPKPALQEPACSWDKKAFVSGFWWLSKTSDSSIVNMEEETMMIRGFEIPVMINSCDIDPSTRLWVYCKPPAEAKPLANAKIVVDDADNDDNDAKPKATPKGKEKATPKKGKGTGKVEDYYSSIKACRRCI